MSDSDRTLVATSREQLPSIPGFELEGVLGEGGMGKVYWGTQAPLGRAVAVKVMADRLARDAEFRARFLAEARILATLQHPNIVLCFAAGTTPDDVPFLAMELVAGPTLHERVAKFGPLSIDVAIPLVATLARALQHAQRQGIIHRDIKPENILLRPEPGSPFGEAFPYEPKIVDLGLGKLRGEAPAGLEFRRAAGSPYYMAPEQHGRLADVDLRADIFSLGCTLYFMLVGRHPFVSNSTDGLLKLKQDGAAASTKVPARAKSLLSTMMAPRPTDRPQDYEALLELLEPGSKAGTRTGKRPAAPGRGRLLLAAAGVGVVAIAVAVAGFSGGIAREAPRAAAPAPAPVPAAARERVALFPDDFQRRLEGWKVAEGKTGWGPREDGPGVQGVNFGREGHVRLRRDLPGGSWRIAGTFELVAGNDAWVAIVNGRGDIAYLRLQDLGGARLARVEHRDPAGATIAGGTTSTPLESPRVRFVATYLRGTLSIALDGDPLAVLVAGQPTAIELGLGPGRATFDGFTIEGLAPASP